MSYGPVKRMGRLYLRVSAAWYPANEVLGRWVVDVDPFPTNALRHFAVDEVADVELRRSDGYTGVMLRQANTGQLCGCMPFGSSKSFKHKWKLS